MNEQLPVLTREQELEALVPRLKQDAEDWQGQAKALLRQLNKAKNQLRDQRATSPLVPVIRRLFERWLNRCEKNAKRTLLTDDRFDKIQARLREGRTEEDTAFIIDLLPHICFRKDGKAFDDIELVCRSGSHWEDFYERAERYVAQGPIPKEPLPEDLRRHLVALSTPQLHKLVRLVEICDCGHPFLDHQLETLEEQRYGWKPCTTCSCLDFSTIELELEAWQREQLKVAA